MYSLSMFILTAALAGSVYPPRSSPLADEVQITVTPDSDEYVAYEPVRLRVEVRNVTAREVTAYLAVSPGEKHCEIQYRRAGGAFVAFPIQRSDRHGVYLPHTLGPGGVVSAEYIVAFDRERGRFVLDGEGIFEFRAVYRDTPDDPNTVLESATISIRSHPVPASEAEHVVAYRNPGLGRLVQFQPFVGSDLPHEAIKSAASFLDEHRDSLYARHVQRGLVSVLGDLVSLGLATEREQALYETLRQSQDRPPAVSVFPSLFRLWPPNHQLVPVQMTVDVSDDEDPNPVVTLVSVTCDDNCDGARDIMGAEIGTDDREFELRAERTGTGQGRTYTITYSATDASGNRGGAEAKVVVPVGEGKGQGD